MFTVTAVCVYIYIYKTIYAWLCVVSCLHALCAHQSAKAISNDCVGEREKETERDSIEITTVLSDIAKD